MQKRFDDQQHDIFIWIFLLTRGSFFKERNVPLAARAVRGVPNSSCGDASSVPRVWASLASVNILFSIAGNESIT